MDQPREVLKLSALKKGDILLSSSAELKSLLIRAAEMNSYSHAFVFLGHGGAIEAVGRGVERKPLAVALASDSHVVVYRYPGLTPAAADGIVHYAEKQVGKRYNYEGALRAGLKTPLGDVVKFVRPSVFVAGVVMDATARFHKDGSSLYCSELVVRAYAAAGLDLGVPLDLSTPGTLQGSGKLMLMGHLK